MKCALAVSSLVLLAMVGVSTGDEAQTGDNTMLMMVSRRNTLSVVLKPLCSLSQMMMMMHSDSDTMMPLMMVMMTMENKQNNNMLPLLIMTMMNKVTSILLCVLYDLLSYSRVSAFQWWSVIYHVEDLIPTNPIFRLQAPEAESVSRTGRGWLTPPTWHPTSPGAWQSWHPSASTWTASASYSPGSLAWPHSAPTV